jgi:thiamine biosynthesis protein ThiI
MDYDLILIRYGELSLKSSYVRKQFKSALVRNIMSAFECSNISCKIKTERGRIYLYTDEISKGFGVLKKVFGITSFSPVVKTTSDIEEMSSLALRFSQKILDKEKSFALRVTRIGEHVFSSQDVAVKLGNVIVDATKAGVDLSNPDFELFIEIRDDNAFFFTEKIRGTGGLPLGTQGKILALVNTPQSLLAAWYLMRRGCDILFLKTNNQIVDTLHSFITNWYAESDIIECDPKEKNLYETVNKIAYERSCDAFVTGHTIYDTSQDILSDIKQFKKHINLPILHPLIAMDFDEIDKKCMELGILE